jgi:hypothetical protein
MYPRVQIKKSNHESPTHKWLCIRLAPELQSKVIYRPVGSSTNNNSELLVYPNPSNNYIIVDFSSLKLSDYYNTLSIYTIDGKLKDKIEIHKSIGFKVLDTRYWKSGIYVVSLQQKKGKAFSNTVIVNH